MEIGACVWFAGNTGECQRRLITVRWLDSHDLCIRRRAMPDAVRGGLKPRKAEGDNLWRCSLAGTIAHSNNQAAKNDLRAADIQHL